ncbi:MAG: YitT family protein [Desulfopila sp.]
MAKWDLKKSAADFFFISAGCVSLAFAIAAILRPNGLITGGVPGFSIVVSELSGIDYTIIYYLATLTILVGAFVFLGAGEGVKILLLSIVFPAVLMFFEFLHLQFIESDLFLATIYYGVFSGIGVGLIFKRGFSLGGSDTLAKILRRRVLPFMSISQLIMTVDVVVILSSLLVYDRNIALYGLVASFIVIKTIDIILFGFGSKMVKMEVISNHWEEISQYILHTIRRGTSFNDIRGGYTSETRTKVVSICSTRESMLIRRYIASRDPEAFVYVIPIASAWGLGTGFYRLGGED